MPINTWGQPTPWSVDRDAEEFAQASLVALNRGDSARALDLAQQARAKAPQVCFQAYHAQGAALSKLEPPQLERALQCLDEGIEVAHRLNPDWTADKPVEWGHMGHRAFMRLLHEKLLALRQSERTAEAYVLARRMLKLNRTDHQGVRILALELAGNFGWIEAMEAIVADYLRDDCGDVDILYADVLVGQLRRIDEEEVRRRLARALRSNMHIARFLMHPDEACDLGHSKRASEAMDYVKRMAAVWNRIEYIHEMGSSTSSAVAWLHRCEAASVPSETKLVAELERCGYLLLQFRTLDGSSQMIEATRRLDLVPSGPQSGSIRPHQVGHAIQVYDRHAEAADGRTGDWRSFKYEMLMATPFFDVLSAHAPPPPTPQELMCDEWLRSMAGRGTPPRGRGGRDLPPTPVRVEAHMGQLNPQSTP